MATSVDESWDAVVVGGGPAGAATAALLAARRWSVLVIDKARFPRDKACAEFASPGVEIVLRRLGAWEAVQALQPRRLRGMQLIGPSGERFAGTYPRGRAIALPRPQLDQAVLDVARKRGATVWENTRVHDLLREGQRVSGVVAAAGRGAVRHVGARLVVGADGLHSTVARRTDAIRPGWWPHRTGLVTHCEGIDGLDTLASYGEMHVRPGAYVGLAPLPGGCVNVAMVLPTRAVRQRGQDVEGLFWHELAQFPALAGRLARVRRTKSLLGTGPLRRHVPVTAGPGYLLVGDAAGFLDPFTGEGIYRALRGAELAAAAADAALRTPAEADAALAEYCRARQSAFRPKEALCLLVQAFIAYPPLLEYALRRLRRRPRLAQRLFGALGDTHSPWATLAALLRP
ncbi:MAG: hypothetical protein CL878_01730 [Dehalococcoidia bacterium]|nr:hypothetical protein [Dehalococcoidia bacterium]